MTVTHVTRQIMTTHVTHDTFDPLTHDCRLWIPDVHNITAEYVLPDFPTLFVVDRWRTYGTIDVVRHLWRSGAVQPHGLTALSVQRDRDLALYWLIEWLNEGFTFHSTFFTVNHLVLTKLNVTQQKQTCTNKPTIRFTVNHKKRDILFLTITLANLNRFL